MNIAAAVGRLVVDAGDRQASQMAAKKRSDAAMTNEGDGPAWVVIGENAVAKTFAGRARSAHVGLIDGAIGAIIAPEGKLLLVLEVAIRDGKIVEISSIADRDTLAEMDLTVLQ